MKKFIKILPLVLILLLGFALPINPPSGNWYQQFMPSLGTKQINDIVFLDSLTGFAVASRNVNPDSASILKTTNGGDTWQIVFTQTPKRFSRIQFINSTTGFVCGGTGGGTPQLYKTTDAGQSWLLISSFGCSLWKDMNVIDENTIWLVDDNSFCGGVFLTINGGLNWIQESAPPSDKIYVFNSRIGFISKATGTLGIYKTINGGQNWNINLPNENFTDMHFTDSLTGWKCSTTSGLIDSSVKMTTNGGLNWIKQHLPTGPNLIQFGMAKFTCINKDTIWGVGSNMFYPNSQVRGILYRTTNGGINWLFQIPDTSIDIYDYYFVSFFNKNNGWVYAVNSGIHTTSGGDTTFLTGLRQISNQIPKEYKLYQNYPNPFNPITNIKYQISKNIYVKLIVYDILGKEIAILVNQKQTQGTYQVDFSGLGSSSGIYFYSLYTDDKLTDTKKMILLK